MQYTQTAAMSFKQSVYNQCQLLVKDKISLLQQNLKDLREMAANETKSTAGDKHETALAMLQIEQENKRKQLADAQEQQAQLDKIDTAVRSVQVVKGSLVKTNRGYLFVSIALGKIATEGIPVITLSPQSPLGSHIMGALKGGEVVVNGIQYNIEEIE